jgi:ActR/RegA family two-component response regulator
MYRPAIVLLVDDEPLVVRALLRSLSSENYEIIPAYSSAEALVVLRTIAAHVKVVLVADLNLKDGNGLDLAREAAVIRPQIRTLFTTGGDAPPGEEHRTFLKPFNNLELRRRILVELASYP